MIDPVWPERLQVRLEAVRAARDAAATATSDPDGGTAFRSRLDDLTEAIRDLNAVGDEWLQEISEKSLTWDWGIG